MTVRCGEWNLKEKGNAQIEVEDHQEIKVKNIILHPSEYIEQFNDTLYRLEIVACIH